MNVLTYKPWDRVSIKHEIERESTGVVKKAYECARGFHNKTKRDDESAGIRHPVKVFQILLHFGVVDPDILAAALLHDAPEDTHEELLATIEEGHGRRVSELVGGVTRLENEKIGKYFKKIRSSPDLIILKLADRLHNLRNMANNLYVNTRFTKARLKRQIFETERWIMPMKRIVTNKKYINSVPAQRMFIFLEDSLNAAKERLKIPRRQLVETWELKKRKSQKNGSI